MILHLRVVPGFWIAVEAGRHPELHTRPVIMGGLPHQRGAVREANLAAQWHGVRAGMTLAQAHQQCPEGIFLAPNLPLYEAVWEDMCAVLSCYTPLVEPIEMGQAVCDLADNGRRWPDWRQVVGEISTRIGEQTGIVPCWGVATNRLVAQLASLQVETDGVTLIERGEERAFLADLPLELLPEIDVRLALTFQVLGLKTIGQLAALPSTAVKARFGALGERLHAYARGIDPRPVVPPPARPVVLARRESPGRYSDGDIEEAIALLHDLAEECGADLQRRSLAGTLIGLTLEWHTSSGNPHSARAAPSVARLPAGSPPDSPGCPQVDALPVPYGVFFRSHSMLARPGDTALTRPARVPSSLAEEESPVPPDGNAQWKVEPSKAGIQSRTAIVRTAISTASPLFERAQQLLLQLWPRDSRRLLKAIELRVGEFEQPRQLAFAELNRLDQTGVLSGMDAGRRQILAQQEQVLAARYGDASFRHLAHVDPAGILTERRFRWAAGLWPSLPAPAQSRRALPGHRRRS